MYSYFTIVKKCLLVRVLILDQLNPIALRDINDERLGKNVARELELSVQKRVEALGNAMLGMLFLTDSSQ
jgi:hypothetical protein